MARQSPVPGTEPGDHGVSGTRGAFSALAASKSPHMKPKLKTECSRGYESVGTSDEGNIRR